MIIFIMGKTCSGKSTVANYLSKGYKIPNLVSYSTRPMRVDDVEGVSHYFIDDAEMDKLWDSPYVIARTKFDNGIRALGLLRDKRYKVMSYIMDPAGLKWFEENSKLGEDYTTIYIKLSEEDIRKRAAVRGDSEEIVESRLNAERSSFDTYFDSCTWDYYIDSSLPTDDVEKWIDDIVQDLIDKGKLEVDV